MKKHSRIPGVAIIATTALGFGFIVCCFKKL